MLERVKQFFSDLQGSEIQQTQIDMKLAATALLVEVARADDNRSHVEQETIFKLLKKHFELSDAETQELLTAANQQSDESVCLYQFTSTIKKNASREQRIKLIQGLWVVAYADGEVDPEEEATIRKIADLLYVSHSDYIQAKLKAAS
ncbi:TerB family tellurite resistance protein [Corallincola platygyrae]|uniref:TerB family tellurite resistance protein n=1 Tax=Corallincola platygyrae TaxID=1193278 RepID=A0ABW4XPX1_9GAMM